MKKTQTAAELAGKIVNSCDRNTFSGTRLDSVVKSNDIILLEVFELKGRMDFDYCPTCGAVFCTINGTKALCTLCLSDELNRIQEAEKDIYDKYYYKVQKVICGYKGTRLFGELRRKGLSEVLKPENRWLLESGLQY